MEKLKVNELFSGIGAQRRALENLGIAHEVVGICEIDKYAIQSYEAIFGKTYNYGDITKVNRLNYADLWTYSFPCQDISVAGKQRGISENTRSGLLYEVQRLLEIAKNENQLPKYLLLENVKNLVGKQFKDQFDAWVKYLEELGYDTYWQVLNAKDYGIPQNRERVFAMSVRKGLNKDFSFPMPKPLTKCIDDLLELNVDEKYYISEEKATELLKKIKISQNIIQKSEIVKIGSLEVKGNESRARVYGTNGICPTLDTMQGGGRQPKILQLPRGKNNGGLKDTVPTITSSEYQYNNYLVESNNKQVQNTIRCGGRGSLDRHAWDIVIQPKIIDDTQGFDGVRTYNDYTPTLRASRSGLKVSIEERIRRLTPLECWRFMGFDDLAFYKAKKSGVSDSQLYKQAGNSIVVKVLEKIFKQLFKQSMEDDMLNEEQLKAIKNNLKNGEEVLITCGNLVRLVDIEKQTFDFPGKLRIKVMGA